MSAKGFRIRQIRVIGKSQPDASLAFAPGLSVISGDSDTGKSYAFQCLQYGMARGAPPKPIDESTGYRTLLVELEVENGRVVTLERGIRASSDLKLYRVPISELGPAAPEPHLLAKSHSASDPANISSQLLSWSGLQDQVILQRVSDNKTRDLWFGDVRPFFMLDEVRIIAESSPIFASGLPTSKTTDQSTFDVLISGEDHSGIIAKPKKLGVRQAEWDARIETLDSIIDPLRQSLSSSDDYQSSLERCSELEDKIDAIKGSLIELGREVDRLQDRRREVLRERRKHEVRESVIEQLIGRFDLLRKSYLSDIERLEFIEEGAHLDAQLGDVFCVTCGSRLDAEKQEHQHSSVTQQKEAARAERAKIEAQLADLDSTVAELRRELEEVRKMAVSAGSAVEECEAEIDQSWKPKAQELEQSLAVAYSNLGNARREAEDWERLQDLEKQRATYGARPKKKTRAKVETEEPGVAPPHKSRREFCDCLAGVLTAWDFPNVGTVEFGERLELIVGGKASHLHGKGYRAIIRSAFAVAMMRHAIARDLPHTGVVVLDSPLTSYKGKYAVSQNIQEAFFHDLARADSPGQVIVFDNKEPPPELRTAISYEYFTGSRETGRYGFFQPLPSV